MTYYKEIMLQNGEKCILRNPTREDAEELLVMRKITLAETNNLMRYPDEVTMTLEDEQEFLEKLNDNPKGVMICAFVGGKMVGNCGMSMPTTAERCCHRVSCGISIVKEFWSMGIGTYLMKAIVDMAKQAKFEFLELEVVSKNNRASSLYKKMGFSECGLIKKGFKYRDGSYADLVMMRLEL